MVWSGASAAFFFWMVLADLSKMWLLAGEAHNFTCGSLLAVSSSGLLAGTKQVKSLLLGVSSGLWFGLKLFHMPPV